VPGARGNTDTVPASEPIGHTPHHCGWSGADVLIDQQNPRCSRQGRFSLRAYTAITFAVDRPLYRILPSQRTDVSIHSPKNCLPATLGLSSPPLCRFDRRQRKAAPCRRICHHQRGQPPVLSSIGHQRGAVSPTNIWQDLLVADAMRMNRTDGALIRVATAINPPKVHRRQGRRPRHLRPSLSLALAIYPRLTESRRTLAAKAVGKDRR